MTPWTSVVSYHTDPESCGVARFSAQLASRLGVPLVAAEDFERWGAKPLLSIKWSEWNRPRRSGSIFPDWRNVWIVRSHDQLWHDEPPEVELDAQAEGVRVWKLYELGVPALVARPVMAHRALFTFGMAHKIDLEKFMELRKMFDLHQLWISTAAHEGAGPSKVPELMRLWNYEARDLGHLSDAALQLIWPRVYAFVAFFEHGLRANNSSVHAALDAGVPVITNHGPKTPEDLRELTTDYRDLGRFYLQEPAPSPYTWDRLLKELGCEPSR